VAYGVRVWSAPGPPSRRPGGRSPPTAAQQHTSEARARGETEERLYLLSAWHESPLYSERERAAPAWTEAVTLVSETHVPDGVYDQARQHFSGAELVNLTLCVAAINAWNRIAISFRAVHPIHWKGAA
jgi:alkylhydroperoxidase family enzyme